MTDTTEGRIYIAAMAERLERAEHTIRQWIKRDDFPAELRPEEEGGRHKLFWVEDQLEGLRQYAAERDSMRGSFGRATA